MGTKGSLPPEPSANSHTHRHLSRVSHARMAGFTPGPHLCGQTKTRHGSAAHTTTGKLRRGESWVTKSPVARCRVSLWLPLSARRLQRLPRGRRPARKSLTGVPQAGVTEQKHSLFPLVSPISAALPENGAALNARPAGCGSERALFAPGALVLRAALRPLTKGGRLSQRKKRVDAVLFWPVKPVGAHTRKRLLRPRGRLREGASGLPCCFPMIGGIRRLNYHRRYKISLRFKTKRRSHNVSVEIGGKARKWLNTAVDKEPQ